MDLTLSFASPLGLRGHNWCRRAKKLKLILTFMARDTGYLNPALPTTGHEKKYIKWTFILFAEIETTIFSLN
jgi:hypothetical protein